MAVETDSDRLATYFNASEHGTVATIAGDAVAGLFENQYAAAVFTGIELDSADPVFYCNTSEVTGVGNGSAITVDGTTYTVRSHQRTGDGVSALQLRAP